MQIANRTVDYMRISVTDRCNERCLYCIPEGFSDWKERSEILTYEEILRVARVAAKNGFRKFRVTGGEPLVRRDVVYFIEELARIPGVETIGLSTNGTKLAELAEPLRRAGVYSVNISLDALTPEVYHGITHGQVSQALDGIRAAIAAGFPRIKLNTVLIRGHNEAEIWPLVQFAAEHNLLLRFIELMPISITEMLSEKNFFPIGEVMELLRHHDNFEPFSEVQYGHGPARYYKLTKTGSVIGFIGAMTNLHFCESCNKVRLTADGKIRPCLGNHGEYDLREILRNGGTDGDLEKAFALALKEKPPEHIFRNNYQPGRVMVAIGG